MNPRVSVIMPAFNREKYIAESIRSVLGQTFKDFELIVIDDGSTDKTLSVAESFASDPRVHIVKNEKHLGIAGTRNKALDLARGEYVSPLDSDDVWIDKEKLAKQTAYLDTHPECALVGGAIRHIDTEGKTLKTVVFEQTDADLRNNILQHNPFPQSSLMYRKQAIIDAGSYDMSFQVCDDYNLWLAVGTKHSFANFPEVFTGYRIHDGNITRTKRLTAAREILEIVKSYASKYPRSSLGITKAYLRLLLAYVRS
jgi:glycosyltransferase involved in cell wall biosynthesis